jgi:hypothetical protein
MKTFLLNFIESSLLTRLLVMSFLLLTSISMEGQNITQFTGGTNISADKAANATSPAYTTLGNLVVAEVNKKDLTTGTLILAAPSGWTFNTTGVTLSGVTGSVAYTNSTTITVTITGGLSNGGTETATISGVSVRATEGANLTASGNIVFGAGSTCVGADGNMVPGTTIFGALSQTLGAMTKLVVTLPGQTFTDGSTVAASGNSGTVTAQTVGTSFNITKLTATDQFFNVVTTFTGSKTIAYSGPGTSSGGSPTYTTTVSFTSGASTTTLATSLRKAETITITATNGGSFGTASSSLVVNPKALTVSSPAVTSKIYDGTTAATITGTLSGILGGDTVTLSGTGTFIDKNVGTGKAVTSTSTLVGTDAANYSLTQPVGLTGTITVRTLTITANNGSKVYGITQSTPVSGATTFGSTGLQNSETIGSVTLTYGAGALTPTASVGSTSTITPSAATGGTFTASNYSITYTPNSGTLTVTAASLTITANSGSKVYGTTQSTPVSGATSFGTAGLQNGETIGSVTLTYGAGALTPSAAVGSTSTITPSSATGGTFTASNYSITYTNGTLTVSAAPLTITATNGGKTYGQTYTVGAGSAAFTSSALQNGETIGTITIASTGAVNTAAVGSYNIVPFAATGGTFTASNYSITYTNGTLTVNAAPLTITANDGSKTYGQTYTVGAGSTAFTPTGLQNSETVGTITIASTGAINTAAVGTYSIVPSAATGGTFTASNYSITYTNGTLTVNTAPLTITANGVSKTYGQTYTVGAGSTAFTPSGLQNSETVGTITIASTGAVNTAAVGTYSIVPSAVTGGTFTASNYSITYTNGTLTVNAASLTITADSGSKTYGQTYTVGAGSTAFTSSALQNGETIGTITIASTGAVNTAAVGSYNIVPSAATGGTFTASNYSITYTNGTLTVNAASLTITADDGSKTYGQTYTVGAGSSAFTSGALQNGETIGTITIASTGAVNTAAVGSYNIVPSAATGGTFTASNYNITYTNGTLTVNTASLTITANNGSKVYGTTQSTPVTGASTFGSTGLQNGETIGTVTLTYGAGALAASDAVGSISTITPSAAIGGTFTASNYSITYTSNSGTLTVTAAPLTITADDASKCFGTTYTLGTTAFTSVGLVLGETIGNVTLNSSGATSGAAVGAYSIVPSAATGGTFTASNYSITYSNGILTVNALPSVPSGTDGERCSTGTVNLSASVGGGETVDWYSAATGGTLLLSGSTSYTTPSISSTTLYYAEARNTTTGCVSSSRAAVTATVHPTSVGGGVSGGTTICSGSTSGLLTLSGHTGLVVRWEYSVSPFSTWTTISNTLTTYTSGVLTQTTQFRAVVQSGTCSEANSADTTVTVDAPSVGGTVASDQTICYGTEPGDLTLSGNTGSVVKWQSSGDVGFTSPTDIVETSTTLAGTTIGSLTTNTYFRAVIQNGVCATANSASVLISIDAITVGGTVSSDQTICSGTMPADLTLSGHTGSVIKWESSLDAGFTSPTDIIETSATLTGTTIGTLTQDTYFRAIVQSGACDVEESASVLITVNDASVAGTVTGGTAICAGSTSSLLTLSGYTGLVVRWEYSVSPFSSWTTIVNTLDTYTSGALTQTTHFRAVVQSGVCPEVSSKAPSVVINTTTRRCGSLANWAPDATTAAIISSAFTSGGSDLDACSLTVNNGSTVIISSGDTVNLSGALTAVAGSLVTFNNNANLIQAGTTNTNSGAIIIKRNSSALLRQDYTLWSSPVASQQLQAFSPLTLSNRFYTYNTNTNLYDLVASPSTTNFAAAQGYLIRMPNNHPVSPTIWVGQFAGVPNNGDYSFTLVNGGAGQRFNLVGNPYPSPIDAVDFVSDANNSSSTTGTLYFWRKTNNTLSPSYCTWTMGGFVSNGEAQVFDPGDVIQTGQGFFVEGTGSGTVNFDNTMRIDNHADQFFKAASIERNRIWLNATSSTGLFSQTMVGYITNATQGVDSTIDGKYINDGSIALTSLIGATPYAIQGRALPFDATDIVPMNFKVTAAGDYTIAIDHVDGLFSGSQGVYLKDNLNGTIHDLHAGGYTFTSEAGNFDSRFELLYQSSLNTTNPVFNANQVIIYQNSFNQFVINSGNTIMDNIKVFDIRGRLLFESKGINASQTIMNADFANEVLLVQIVSDQGTTVTKKIIK